jgi:hypothetical protein
VFPGDWKTNFDRLVLPFIDLERFGSVGLGPSSEPGGPFAAYSTATTSM